MRLLFKTTLATLLMLLSTSVLQAKALTLDEMTVKLAKLEASISQDKLNLMKREVKLNEMKVKSLQSTKIDRNKMVLKLAEIESSLTHDKLLLTEREAKLYEMKAALIKQKQQ